MPCSAVHVIFVVPDARSGTADAPPGVSFLARPPVSATPRGAATAASGLSGTMHVMLLGVGHVTVDISVCTLYSTEDSWTFYAGQQLRDRIPTFQPMHGPN